MAEANTSTYTSRTAQAAEATGEPTILYRMKRIEEMIGAGIDGSLVDRLAAAEAQVFGNEGGNGGYLVVEECRPALEFAQQQLQAKTEDQNMSTASYDFARSLLVGFGISVQVDTPNDEEGSSADPSPWRVETSTKKAVYIGEHQGTQGARDWFHQNFLQDSDEELGLTLVTGRCLPELKANQRRATGKGDLVIGKKSTLDIDGILPYEHAHGLVELKTDKYPLKAGQNVLELASLATISRFNQNVALLATDCGNSWDLVYFRDATTMIRRTYVHGRKCWEDFKELLDSVDVDSLKKLKTSVNPNFETIGEMSDDRNSEQDLSGFDDVGPNNSKKLGC